MTHIPVHASLIVRNKYTESQTKLNLQQRQENVGSAFAINPRHCSCVRGKSLILVDDVITTGSTINACAKAVRTGGASAVFAASVAIAK